MKIKTAKKNTGGKSRFLPGVIVLLAATLILGGCARPNEENIKQLLSKTYQCKWLKLDAYEKVESLPGIWSYVVRYKFNLHFVNGEDDARQFMRGMYNTTPGVMNWQKVFENPAAHAYIREECALPAQKVMEQVAIHTYTQLDDKSAKAVEIPVSVRITGWAEMTPGRAGWNMDMRRDKVDPDFVLSAPIDKGVLTAKPGAKKSRPAK